jgi:hypothetical protein
MGAGRVLVQALRITSAAADNRNEKIRTVIDVFTKLIAAE